MNLPVRFLHVLKQGCLRITALLIVLSFSLIGPLNTLRGASQASPQEVKVGFYILNIYDLSVATNSYYGEFYMWLRWKGDVNPADGLSFENLVEQGSFILTPLQDNDSLLADGSRYKSFRVEGRFFEPFNVSNFPLDVQKLTFVLESDKYNAETLVFVPDNQQSSIHKNITVSGWNILGHELEAGNTRYQTSFGLDSSPQEDYSTMTFSLKMERPLNFFFWKLMFPFLIVVLSGTSFMFFSAQDLATRINLPVYSLLTIVFLQMSYSAIIPETSYLVMMDRIYVAAYTFIVLSIAQIIVFGQLSKRENANLTALEKKDRQITISCTILFIVYIIAESIVSYQK
jgi:hypothetical protein